MIIEGGSLAGGLDVGSHEPPTVTVFPYLGILFDDKLRFDKFFAQLKGRLELALDELVNLGASMGMAAPIVARGVLSRVQGEVLSVMSILASYHGGAQIVDKELNDVQAACPAKILGAPGFKPGRRA